jgi:uncharacterized phage protein gp47/JayE
MITLLTREEIITDLQAYLVGLLPNINVSIDCDAGIRIALLADAIIGLQCNAVSIEDDLFPDTASTEALEKHAAARLGDPARKAATVTEIVEDALAVSGTIAADIPAGSTLIATDGTRYQTTAAAVISGIGAAVCDLQSITTGTIANKLTLEILTFETPPTGIDADAQLAKDMIGAVDQETDAELLVRLLDMMRNPPGGGRFSAYRQWAMAVQKVSSAYVYGPSSIDLDGRRGLGIVDVAILGPGTGADRVPSATTQQAVEDYIEERRPSAMKEFSVLLPGTEEVDFDLQITPAPGYEWDWELSGSSYHVHGWDAGTKKLTWNTTLPTAVVAGVRIMLESGRPAVVASVGADYTILDRVISGPSPQVNELIYPGGPLTLSTDEDDVEYYPVQDAITAYMDALGPARGDAPDPEQAGWEDSVKLAKIYKAVILVEGVDDVVIVAPAANVVPDDHAPSGTVDILIGGEITVRPV